MTNFALFGGAFMTPVVVGKITTVMGWRWPFYFVGIFAGVCVPFVSKPRGSELGAYGLERRAKESRDSAGAFSGTL